MHNIADSEPDIPEVTNGAALAFCRKTCTIIFDGDNRLASGNAHTVAGGGFGVDGAVPDGECAIQPYHTDGSVATYHIETLVVKRSPIAIDL